MTAGLTCVVGAKFAIVLSLALGLPGDPCDVAKQPSTVRGSGGLGPRQALAGTGVVAKVDEGLLVGSGWFLRHRLPHSGDRGVEGAGPTERGQPGQDVVDCKLVERIQLGLPGWVIESVGCGDEIVEPLSSAGAAASGAKVGRSGSGILGVV
ncbi:hypothetical protein DQ354_12380 [Arthrobacter sp. AQ5-06]|nr:hypothetical protein DQ354_12380 [Arthrobacter sp. AQ5-06]